MDTELNDWILISEGTTIPLPAKFKQPALKGVSKVGAVVGDYWGDTSVYYSTRGQWGHYTGSVIGVYPNAFFLTIGYYLKRINFSTVLEDAEIEGSEGDTYFPFSETEVVQVGKGTITLWELQHAAFSKRGEWERLYQKTTVCTVTRIAEVICLIHKGRFLEANQIYPYCALYLVPGNSHPIATQLPSTTHFLGIGETLFRLCHRAGQLELVHRSVVNRINLLDEAKQVIDIGPGPKDTQSIYAGWLGGNGRWGLLLYGTSILVVDGERQAIVKRFDGQEGGRLASGNRAVFFTAHTIRLWHLEGTPKCLAKRTLVAADLGKEGAEFTICEAYLVEETCTALVCLKKNLEVSYTLYTFLLGETQVSHQEATRASGPCPISRSHKLPLSQLRAAKSGMATSHLKEAPPFTIRACTSDQLVATYDDWIHVFSHSDSMQARIPGELLGVSDGRAWVRNGDKVSLISLDPYEQHLVVPLADPSAHLAVSSSGVLVIVGKDKKSETQINRWQIDGQKRREVNGFLVPNCKRLVLLGEDAVIFDEGSRDNLYFPWWFEGGTGSMNSGGGTPQSMDVIGVGSYLLAWDGAQISSTIFRGNVAGQPWESPAKPTAPFSWQGSGDQWALARVGNSFVVVEGANPSNCYLFKDQTPDSRATLLDGGWLAIFKKRHLEVRSLATREQGREYDLEKLILAVTLQGTELVCFVDDQKPPFSRLPFCVKHQPLTSTALPQPSQSRRLLKIALVALFCLYCTRKYLNSRKVVAQPGPPPDTPPLPRPTSAPLPPPPPRRMPRLGRR